MAFLSFVPILVCMLHRHNLFLIRLRRLRRGGVGVVVWWCWWLSSEMTDEQEHELMATNEQLAQARDTIDELRHKDEQSKALVSDVEAREQALKGKFDQYVKASADKLKFFQAQFDSACTMRDRYKSELGAHVIITAFEITSGPHSLLSIGIMPVSRIVPCTLLSCSLRLPVGLLTLTVE